jgi:Family of unknown function (DUF6220)
MDQDEEHARGATVSDTNAGPAQLTGYRAGALKALRWGALLFLVLGAVQIFLAGLGVFDLDGRQLGSSGETAFDPHRVNGNIMSAVALLLLILVLVARPGARLIVLTVVLFLLMAVAQPLLAEGGEDQAWVGGLHALVGIGLLGLASRIMVESRSAVTTAAPAPSL